MSVPQSKTKESLGIIGVGAFGGFMVSHLAPHFDMVLCDPHSDIGHFANEYPVTIGDWCRAASCDVVVVAVPVQKLEAVLREIAPIVRPGALVVDVASIKIGPTKLMMEILPAHVDIVGTHPLFGPQSGRDGIKGLNMAVCNVRGARADAVCRFLEDKLKLTALRATPEEHDREMAWVQGLTHLLAKVIVSLDLPEFRFTTRAFEYMQKVAEMLRYDSDELFRAIEKENPFTAQAKQAFFAAARKLEDKLNQE